MLTDPSPGDVVRDDETQSDYEFRGYAHYLAEPPLEDVAILALDIRPSLLYYIQRTAFLARFSSLLGGSANGS